MLVDLVTIHHEGGGTPSDNVDRFADGGYCYGIGLTYWKRWRAPADGWATMNFNGEDLTLCLSGNRMTSPVTDSDLDLIHGAFLDSFNRGEVTVAPLVRAHRNSPGSVDRASRRPNNGPIGPKSRPRASCRGAPSTPSTPGGPTTGGDDDMPNSKDFVDAYSSADGAWRLQYDGGVETIRGPFYGSYFTLPANVRNDPGRRFLSITAPTNGSAKGYALHSIAGEAYDFTKPA